MVKKNDKPKKNILGSLLKGNENTKDLISKWKEVKEGRLADKVDGLLSGPKEISSLYQEWAEHQYKYHVGKEKLASGQGLKVRCNVCVRIVEKIIESLEILL